MRRWLTALPVIGLLGLAILGAGQLMNPEKGDFAREARKAPDRAFEAFSGSTINFGAPAEHARIVNLFASWCGPCRAEHHHLVDLGEAYPGQVFGVLYKDSRTNGDKFLTELGNPFTDVALDEDGQGGLDFGLTGVPETFVISANGDILLHINEPLTEASVKKVGEALKSASPLNR